MRNYEKVSENVLDIIGNTIRDNATDLDPNITKAKIISLFVLVKKCDFSGKMEKTSGVWKYLSDFNYVLLLHKSAWLGLSGNQQNALVFHELMHIKTREDKDGKISWIIRRHDVEEFTCVVRKFRSWSPQLKVLESFMRDTEEEMDEEDTEEKDTEEKQDEYIEY